jgi:hypothetical protein
MQAADAVVVTLPRLPDGQVAEMAARFGELPGIVAAYEQDSRGASEIGAEILLKVAADGPGERPRLLAALDSAIDLLHRRSISGATLKLPDGFTIEVTATDPVGGGTESAPPGDDRGGTYFRLGFAMDIADYTGRSVPAQRELQQRLADLTAAVLADIRADAHLTDMQEAGDGIVVFLPSDTPFERVLPMLLRLTARRLRTDNLCHTDRLRLRMATVIGPVARSALGFTEGTVVELCRLLDSDALRKALRDDPSVDLAVLVSDVLYGYVVGAGHPGLEASDFVRLEVAVKTFHALAWLWTTASAHAAPPG